MAARYAVEFRSLSKSFGGVHANRDIDLRVRAGSVHAIVGENGAGKSTAMKMLYGMIRPDSGEILVSDELRHWRSPQDAIRAGIGMVHQHFMLAGPYTVLENILLGCERGSGAFGPFSALFKPVDHFGGRKRLEEIASRYGLQSDWDARVEDLGVGAQQRIEIIKLLYRDARVLILDEPTAVLTPQETTELFTQLRRLRDEGKTILIITHKLKEVLGLADEVTVFRAGTVAGHRLISETNVDDLATLMVGRRVNLRVESAGHSQPGRPVLEVQNLRLASDRRGEKRVISGIDLEVRAGEIVGIAGVEGNGQSELIGLIARPGVALRAFDDCEGRIRILGRDTLADGRPRLSSTEFRELDMGVIPEDRHREGLLLDRPVTESYLLGRQRDATFSRGGVLSMRAVEAEYARAAEDYDIRPRSSTLDARRLSGGNQQKIIIAREIGTKTPSLLIAAQPTRGVDVGAIELIHKRILKARAEGAGVLLISSELDEVMALSDRVLVLFEGRIAASFDRGAADERTIGLYMGGGAVQ